MAKSCRKNHFTFQEKKHVLEEYLSSNKTKYRSLKAFSRLCNINYGTLRNWGNRIDWNINRIDELKRKRRKPSPMDSKSGMSQAQQEKILEIKSIYPNWGPLKIKQYLWRHEQILIPQSSIYRLLKDHGLVQAREPKTDKKKHGRKFEYPVPLAGVQMDLMQVVLSNAVTIYLVSLMDDFSRYILASRFIAVKTMKEVMDVFKETIRAYGVMDTLLTDCGSEFVSWQRFTSFEELLCALDVEYIASGPDKKENQGKIERWHQTVREELRLHGPLDYSSEAQFWIREVCNMYNYERPHQGIGGLVPADRFFGMSEEIAGELERCKAEQRLDRQIYFTCRVGDKKVVLSGQNPESVNLLINGKAV
jgi:transposase InsO family protein